MGKKKQASTLGRQIIKDRFGNKNRQVGDSFLHTSDLKDGYDWGRLNLQSVTEQNNLEEFLSTAEMAGTEFTAEKLNVKFVTSDNYGGIPQGDDLKKIHGLHKQHQKLLRIPRRPPWRKEMSTSQLDQNEREAFLEWRRKLSSLQEVDGLVMTPYEKNLDFWRQLWRVIERSDVVVQIVDARNPLLFYCPDLEQYVQEVDPNKVCLLLINKADFLTQKQRDLWAKHFTKKGVRIAFWSALEEANRQEQLSKENDNIEHINVDNIEEEENDDDEEEEEEKMTENFGSIAVEKGLDSPIGDIKVDCDKFDNNGDYDDDFVDKYGQKIIVTKTEGHAKSKETRSQSQKSLLTEMNHSDSQIESVNDRMDTDSGDKLQDNLVCDSGNTDDNVKTEIKEIPQAENMDCKCGEDSDTGNDKQTAKHAALANSSKGSHCDLRNSSKLYLGEELLDLFRSLHSGPKVQNGITTVGMVGYPNVGKSSTINAILRMKKVPVSATPGRTKHFQTLFVDSELMLCDCPGLVFPSFVTTKADLVVSGILPVDQMRDHIPPTSLVCQLIPRTVLEQTYGIIIPAPGEGEDPARPPTSHELLNAYGAMRGYMTARGVPDCPRSSRYILKDYVNGKLLYCHPPPDVDPVIFNPVNCDLDPGAGGDSSQLQDSDKEPVFPVPSKVDKEFFRPVETTVHSRTARSTSVEGASSGSPHSSQGSLGGKPWKRHNNRHKKEKLRRVYGYLDDLN